MRVFFFCFLVIAVFGLPGGVAQAVPKESYRKFGKHDDVQPIASKGATSVYDGIIAAQAQANAVPVSLIHRVFVRESRYNARAVSGGNYGLMQIRFRNGTSYGLPRFRRGPTRSSNQFDVCGSIPRWCLSCRWWQ